MNSHARPSQQCCKGPQGATRGTRSLAPSPLGRRPQAAWSVHCTTRRLRTAVPAPSIKRISSSNPERPLRDGCRRQAPPSTMALFYSDSGLSWCSPASKKPAPAPAATMDTHKRFVAWVAQPILGPARLVPTTPPSQPGFHGNPSI